MDLRKQQRPIIVLEVESSTPSWEQMSADIGVHIPETIEAKVRAERQSSEIHAMIGGYIKPSTPESKKMKGTALVDIAQRKIEGELSYDLDRNPSAEVAVNARYEYDYSQKYASIK